jgi:hypothetical protein
LKADDEQVVIIGNAAHPAAMGLLKVSALALFRSIFPSRTFRMVCVGMAIFVTLWTVVCIVTGTALCVPLETLWNPAIGGYCFPYATMGLTATSLHILTDVAILLLPITPVLKLQVSRSKKALVISMFMVGGT